MKTRIEKITGINVENLSPKEIVDNVVLPKILLPTGQYTRGWRISDEFMNLMADFGKEFYKSDFITGCILLEIAMQRISCGAVLHEATPIALPTGYERYSVEYDQPGLMSDGCWNFLNKQAAFCLQLVKTNKHMQKILFGLIDHLTPEGNTLNGFMLGSTSFSIDAKEVYAFAFKAIEQDVPKIEIFEYFATPERYQNHIDFFKKNWNMFDEKDFFSRIGKTGFFEKRRIKKEILK